MEGFKQIIMAKVIEKMVEEEMERLTINIINEKIGNYIALNYSEGSKIWREEIAKEITVSKYRTIETQVKERIIEKRAMENKIKEELRIEIRKERTGGVFEEDGIYDEKRE